MLKMRDFTWQLGRKTYVMGILNVTPDSFSDGGKYFDCDKAIERALKMQNDGVDILDIGGQSTRPGHIPISADQEWARLEPVIKSLKDRINIPISIDTFYPDVAKNALEHGAAMINDISGVVNAAMASVIKEYSAGWVIMHNGQIPEHENAPDFVHQWLCNAAKEAESYGALKECICIDPGIGFGKTHEQNLQLIKHTPRIKVGGYAYLLAASRKRCIGQPAGNPVFELRDSGTVAANTIGIWGGADIIRVHDSFGGVQAARVADAIKHS